MKISYIFGGMENLLFYQKIFGSSFDLMEISYTIFKSSTHFQRKEREKIPLKFDSYEKEIKDFEKEQQTM